MWIEANTATTTGSNVYIVAGAPTLVGATILDGDTWFGGGMRTDGAAATLIDVEFRGNHGWYGGAVYESAGSTTTYSSVRFLGNTSDQGAALYVDDYSVVTLDHCAIVGNDATIQGGGVALGSGSVVDLTDSVVALNQSSNGGGGFSASMGTVDLEHCDVWGNTPDDYAGMADPTGTQGNVSVDPLFVDTSAADAWDWDLHLQVSSPLVDAGGGSSDPDGSTSDVGIYGGAYGGTWDLDLDGYPEWWQPGAYDAATYPGQGWDCDDEAPGTYPGSGC